VIALARIVLRLLADLAGLVVLSLRPRPAMEAENLFLRRQLALHQERGIKPRRVDAATRVSLALLSRLFDWRDALVVVRPETQIRWHRAGWRLFWRLKSRPGRPPIPLELRQLIRRMATENPLWGEERIANELLLKLGLRVSPRTVRKYLPKRPPGRHRGDQRWSTFLHNHARAIVACDFFVAVTATFRLFYVLVLIEHGSRLERWRWLDVHGALRQGRVLHDGRGRQVAQALDRLAPPVWCYVWKHAEQVGVWGHP
jgi:hypothetical protein